jgi:GntR family transcriptional regulator, gluconate operon transcriptional repressor
MMKVTIKYRDADKFALQDVLFHETIIRSINHAHMLMIWDKLKPVMECLILLSMRLRIKEEYEDFQGLYEIMRYILKPSNLRIELSCLNLYI